MHRTFFGDAAVEPPLDLPVEGGFVRRDGRDWYEIRHHDRLAPFFMSIVSSADHWWFVASTGGMTAGRRDADHAFLPYETEDKVTLGVDQSGPLTVLRLHRPDGGSSLWEPLAWGRPRVHRLARRLRKSVEGDALCFEESNLDLGMTFSMTLRCGDEVGFVRTVELRDDAGAARRVDVLDGYRNLLPHGATQTLTTRMSSLLDAYKRNERDPETGLGLFSLSSQLTDRAEPSEALRANVVWSLGLPADGVLLTPDARIDAFRAGERIEGDTDVRGRRAAFLAFGTVAIEPGGGRRWHTVADVSCDAKAVGRIRAWLRDEGADALEAFVEADLARGTQALRAIVARADGLSVSADRLATTHHFANALFNVMRGGVFADGHRVDASDFGRFVDTRNHAVHARHAAWIAALPEGLTVDSLVERAERTGDVNLIRLSLEYLPLVFSRRHGDPSRPWNRFSIRLRNDDGTPRTAYEGNWRDIFQNWEPLAYAYPAFARSMVVKFLNATTVDGYNPYRVTRDSVEWEVPEPDDPWSNLGYWGDHQIIYLQKLLETVERLEPGALRADWDRALFSSADVPYRLASYSDTVRDWSNTVTFDEAAHARAMARVAAVGTDGRLVPATTADPASEGAAGFAVHHVTMVEKLLVLLLAKLVNLVPGGGIWMNTQRPEWNDANNALVGKGVSVVTAAYLRRFLAFWIDQVDRVADGSTFTVGRDAAELAREVTRVLAARRELLVGAFDPARRRELMDALGAAGTAYRGRVYEAPASPRVALAAAELRALLDVALAFVDHTLSTCRRDDGLAHSYQLLRFAPGEAHVDPLGPMLEGQVAMVSSGRLSPLETLDLLRALRASPLYSPKRRTYLLYPDKALPGFLEKNRFPAGRVESSALAAALRANGDDRLVTIDAYDGDGHFGGDLRNAADLAALLDTLADDPRYAALVAAEREAYLALFEQVFDHQTFTGRSGTFFAYEGLGSVYWHMVSKLLLAVQERFFDAVDAGADEATVGALADAYEDVRAGLGFQRSPADYGAFPTDPYSHTPETGTARQPGMTGQVKEELLTRLGELGVRVSDGTITFEPRLLRAAELLSEAGALELVDVDGRSASVPVPAGGLGFTYAQTPIVYETGASAGAMRISWRDGRMQEVRGKTLPPDVAAHVFLRDGEVREIRVRTRPGRR